MLIYKCQKCLQLSAKLTQVCSDCLGQDFDQQEVSDEGRLVTWTTVRRAPAGYAHSAPYEVVVVDLECGLRVTGRLDVQSPRPTMFAKVRRQPVDEECPIFSILQSE